MNPNNNFSFNKILRNKYALLALPFGLALFFGFFLFFLPQDKQQPVPSQDTPTVAPAGNSTISPSPLTPRDGQSYQEALIKQEQSEREFGEEQAAIITSYPWLESLPLRQPNYFAYFNVEKKAFIGLLYPRTSGSQSIDSQVAAMKTTILGTLNQRNIPASDFPFAWKVTPEP